MSAPAFGAAVRIARRDVWRNKGRSILVLVLVGLPVLILSIVDIGWRTYQLSPSQTLDRQVGAADLAVMSGPGGAVKQSPKGWLDGGGYVVGTAPTAGPQTAAALRRTLPAGARVISELTANAPAPVRARAGVQYAAMIGLDYADPIARGLVVQVAGRAPRTPDQVAVTSKLAATAGLGVGSTLAFYGQTRTFTVVGVVHDTRDRFDQAIYAAPSVVARLNPASEVQTTWLVDTGTPVSWSQVLALNRLGYIAVSRHVWLDPPPASEVAYHDASGVSTRAVTATALVIGMALLEIVLMAGPAFAVTARRQRRELALLAAAGGRRRDLRNVVLANGLVLGLTAGVVAVAGAIGLTAALLALFGDRTGTYAGPFDVRGTDLAGLALVSLGTAVLAALFPAWSAARLDVLAALAGRRGQVRVRRRTPVIGVVLAGLGIGVALLGEAARFSIDVILAGVVVTELGLIIATPMVISALARLGRRLPFAPRLALRDAARNRSSTAPAVAAIMACMIGAIAIAVVTTSQTDLDRRYYRAQLPTDVAYAAVGSSQPGFPQPTPAEVSSALTKELASRSVAPVYALDEPACLVSPKPGQLCTVTNVSVNEPGGSGVAIRTLPRYRGSAFNTVLADDGAAVGELFGQPVPTAAAALRSGTAVVTDPRYLHDGKVLLAADSYSFVPLPSGGPTGRHPAPTHRVVAVPAIAVTSGFPAAQVILPTSVATQVTHTAPHFIGVAALLARRPTTDERQAVDQALTALQPGLRIQTEDGFRAGSDWPLYALLAAAALIALGAAAVATGLANVDGRADLVTLAAVGATPRSRRVISMSRAGLIAGLGCVVGALAGLIPALAWIRHTVNVNTADLHAAVAGRLVPDQPQLRFVIPWPVVAALVIGIPLVATLISALTTKARLPSETRTD